MANPAANYRACPCFPARSFEKKNPEGAYHWHFEGTPNFCLIKIEATRMEFLQLDGVKHIRAEKIVSDEEEAIRWIAPLTEIIFNKINKLCLEPPLVSLQINYTT